MHSNTTLVLPLDTEPSSAPARTRLFVAVRRSRYALTLRPFVDPLGVRTGVAFTSPELLRSVLGDTQQFLEIGENALRSMLRAAGTHTVRIDPRLTAQPADRPAAPPTPQATTPRRHLRLEGFAA